jgi:hypothetical protein
VTTGDNDFAKQFNAVTTVTSVTTMQACMGNIAPFLGRSVWAVLVTGDKRQNAMVYLSFFVTSYRVISGDAVTERRNIVSPLSACARFGTTPVRLRISPSALPIAGAATTRAER